MQGLRGDTGQYCYNSRDKIIMSKVSLSISAAWHLLCIITLRVVILPEELYVPKYSSIVFIGPLLEKLYIESEFSERDIYIKNVAEKTVPTHYDYIDRVTLDKPQVLILRDSALLHSEGLEPKPKRDLALNHQYLTFSGFHLEGDVTKGQILFLPEPPDYKIVAQRLAGQEVALKFSVSPNGTIKYVEKLISSGDPSLDVAWVRNILKWRFVPDGRVRWGVVRFKI